MFICRGIKSHKIKNRTRRTHGARIGRNYIVPDCYAPFWSYGEMCVHCGCCGKPSEERDKARLNYWKEMAKEYPEWEKPKRMMRIYEGKIKEEDNVKI